VVFTLDIVPVVAGRQLRTVQDVVKGVHRTNQQGVAKPSLPQFGLGLVLHELTDQADDPIELSQFFSAL